MLCQSEAGVLRERAWLACMCDKHANTHKSPQAHAYTQVHTTMRAHTQTQITQGTHSHYSKRKGLQAFCVSAP